MIDAHKHARWLSVAIAAAVATPLAATHTLAADPQADDNTVSVALVELEEAVLERPEEIAFALGGESDPTIVQIVETIERVAGSPEYDALVFRLKGTMLTMTQAEEIGVALQSVTDADKDVHLFAEFYGPAELVLGSYASELIMQSGGAVSLPGMYMEEMFLADTLDWIGVEADFVQVGDYKGAAEALSRSGPSKEWDQNISSLLDSLYFNLRTHIRDGRSLTDAQLDNAMREGIWSDAQTAIRTGLIDADVDLPDLEKHLSTRYNAGIEWNPIHFHTGSSMDMSNPFAIFSLLSKKPQHTPTGPTIAVVHIDGAIVDGESSSGGLFDSSTSVGSRTIRRALAQIEDDPNIRGVIVRINSPGGSATASEVIWRGLRKVAATKPVWASVGDMAASGGYYIAVGTSRIHVNPSSIVGSIGVVGGKLTMGGLYDELKINVVPRARGPRAEMMSTVRPWNQEQREFIRERMTETYDLFTKRVTTGRPGIDLSRTAEGRLFAGPDAVKLNMADGIATLDQTIDRLASELGLGQGEYDVYHYPAPRSFEEIIEEAFGGMAKSPGATGAKGVAAATLAELFGPRAWPSVRDSLDALSQIREEPVLLTSPRVLIFR